MYMQHERHSDSDPNSRHQQTEQSYLKYQWKMQQSKSQQDGLGSDDPRAKPSQTKASYLRKHHKPTSPESQTNQEPICTCKAKRSKSADPPPVKSHTCPCNANDNVCPQTKVKPPGGSFKSALSACTRDVLDPCMCSNNAPHWANQSNLVSGSSVPKAMERPQIDPSKSQATAAYSCNSNRTKTSAQDPCKSQLKTCASKSEPDLLNQHYQSGVTWLSALKDADSPEPSSPQLKGKPCPAYSVSVAQSSKGQSMVSCPQSGIKYHSMESESIDPRTRHPCNQPSFGVDYETSATTRSQSIVGKITCLCTSTDDDIGGECCNANEEPDQENFMSCLSARIQHPSAFSDCYDEDCHMRTSTTSKRVSLRTNKSQEDFCDCDSIGAVSVLSKTIGMPSATFCQDQKSENLETSLRTHRSLSGGSCLCRDDEEERPNSLSQEPCVLADCKCYIKTSKYDISMQGSVHQKPKEINAICSCSEGFKTPDDPCSAINKKTTRKERVLRLVDQLTQPSCDCGVSRPEQIQKLFREITLLLRSENEDAVAPIDEPGPPCLTFEECCAAKHEAEHDSTERMLTKRELRRVECFGALEDYLRKCFLPVEQPPIPVSDVYGFERDPDFSPEGETASNQMPNICSEPAICQPTTEVKKDKTTKHCFGGDLYYDCEGSDENVQSAIGPFPCGEKDLCTKLKVVLGNNQKEILKLCEASPNTVPKEEPAEQPICPFAGMLVCPDPSAVASTTADAPFPPSMPCDPSVCKGGDEENEDANSLSPPAALPPEVRDLCEELFRQALKDCGLCPGKEDSLHSCEECDECPDECPGECPGECNEEDEEEECPEPCKGECPCLCCHCRALICDNECQTVAKTLRSAMCDPLCEMKYFIDSMIVDLHAMDCVLGNKKAKPKEVKANDASNTGPGDSFPVTITSVSSLGCSALYVRWEIEDCRAIAGYEIYVDGHLTNRFYSFKHEAGVIANVDVTNPHQIVLRAQAVGQSFPGQGDGVPRECGCQAVEPAHPELAAGAERPWVPCVFYYDPNQH
ncbi:hypothetical protein KR009_004980 [Drosophila setifemur]|nr:hypothetical protein KR009_004980 [Drosophila setifemur]